MTGVDLTRRRELGQLVEDAWGLYTGNLGLFLPIAIVIIVPIDLLVLGVGFGELWHPYDDSLPLAEGFAPSLLTFLIFQPLVTAAHVAAVMALGSGERPTPWWSIARGLERWAAVLATIFIAAIAIVLGTLFFLIPGIYLAVALFFAPQAVVAENRHPFDALRRSRQLVRGDWWRVFGIGVVFSVMIGVINALFKAGGAYAGEAADAQALVLLGSMIGDVFTIAFTALAATLVFFDLRVRSEGVPPPPRWAPAGWEAPTPAQGPGSARTS